MKKYCLFVVYILVSCLLFSGCNFKQSSSPIRYERRLEKYLPEQSQQSVGTIDLSEGPKTNYNAKFGPRDLDFEVKLHTKY